MPSFLDQTTDARFAADVLSGGRVLVDFGADWCPPCRAMEPVLAELAAERGDLRVVSLDTDANQESAAAHGVLGLPTFVLFEDGVEVGRAVGARPKRKLLADLGLDAVGSGVAH